MGWLSRWTAKGREGESLRAAGDALARGHHEQAWALARAAIVERGSPEALHVAGRIARARGEDAIATRLDLAADDPADVSRAADASSALALAGALDAAIAVLERALHLAPFDAVLRSELAVLLARAARPAESAACLALHPCLADDPGALFQFAWSSMLAGDARAAHGCVGLLGRVHAELARVLEAALARHDVGELPRTARDWLFVEHGAVLLRDGAHDRADPDDASLVPALRAALDHLGPRPARVCAAGEEDDDLARSIARALGADHVHPARAGVPAGLVVARDASSLAHLAEHVAEGARVLTFAAVLPIDGGAPVAHLVGALARRRGAAGSSSSSSSVDAASVATFVAPRAALVRARRARSFVPDAPIAWP